MFTFFGQFFDHGVDQTVKSGGTVFVPLKADDPLITLGPDDMPEHRRRGPGEPALHGADPRAEPARPRRRPRRRPGHAAGREPTTPEREQHRHPWVDQSQTYTSHSSHQVFLREYVLNTAGRPVATGKLLGGCRRAADGVADGRRHRPGRSVKAAGRRASSASSSSTPTCTNIPMLATDPYGNFLPGPARGLPQYVTATGLVEGNLAAPVPVPGERAALRHAVPDRHRAQRRPEPGRTPTTTPGTPAGRRRRRTRTTWRRHDFANQPAGHLRRRDARRALHLR